MMLFCRLAYPVDDPEAYADQAISWKEIMEPRPRFELGTLASSGVVTKAMLLVAKHLPG